jgi:hypothetical protein
MFLAMDQKALLQELQRERNNELITNFASDYSLRFLIMQKNSEKEVRLEGEWIADMLTTANIIIIKRSNFNIYKDITPYKISEMLQVLVSPSRWSTSTSRTRQTSSTSPTNTSTSFSCPCWVSTRTSSIRSPPPTRTPSTTSCAK